MKKLLIILTFFGCLFLGMSSVEAATTTGEVDLRDIETNTYIVGDRIYELNKYPISLYDIVNAAVEYANNHNGEMAPIYYYVGATYDDGFLIEYTGPIDPTTGIAPTERVEIEDVYTDGIMYATAINEAPSYNYVKEVVEPEILAAVEKLNLSANEYGFHSIDYDVKTKTGTFIISDLDRNLADYRGSAVITYFLSVASYAESITYTINGEEVTVSTNQLDTQKVTEIAYALLSELAGDAEELTYASVANKSASATVKFVYDGFEYVEEFTLAFVYDALEDKDLDLEKIAKELAAKEESKGFESITYDAETKTGTFKIKDLDASLAAYKDSGIVTFFLEFIKDAKSITYMLDGEEVTVLTKDLDSAKVVEIAYALLLDMAGDAEELTYASVANRSASAKVVYETLGDEVEVIYTVSFVYDIEEVKDEQLTELAKELAAKEESKGFESITYDAETKTGIFKIKDLDASLAAYKDSGIVTFFLEFIKGAKSITYILDGEEVTVLTKDLDSASTIEIAYALLSELAGDAEELTYGSVANKNASAKVVYEINGDEIEVIYTVAFVYNIEEVKDVELAKLANELAAKEESEGFESIVYDANTNTGTFTIKDETAKLADYKDSGIVTFFLEFIKDAKSITYTIAGEEITVLTKDLDSAKTVEIAYALLLDMAGDAEELTYASVANKNASAKVVYEVNGEEVESVYTVAFKTLNK